MREFWILTGYELKKMFRRKILWIIFGILMVLNFSMPFVSMLDNVNENETYYEKAMKNKASELEISGSKIDDALLSKFQDFEKRMPDGLYNFLNRMLPTGEIPNVTAENVYQARKQMLEKSWKDLYLSKGEIAYLQKQEAKLEIPFTYQYSKGIDEVASILFSTGVIMTLFIAACIPAIFAEEYTLKMNPLIQSSRRGGKTSFWAKVFAGEIVTAVAVLCSLLVSAIPAFLLFGLDGWNGQIQIISPSTSFSITNGELLLLLIGLTFIASFLQTAIAMALAERFRSSVGTMAILVGVLILSFFLNVPERFRVLSQLISGLPGNALSVWGVLDTRMVYVFGKYFTQSQVVFVAYLLLSGAAILYGYRSYSRYRMRN